MEKTDTIPVSMRGIFFGKRKRFDIIIFFVYISTLARIELVYPIINLAKVKSNRGLSDTFGRGFVHSLKTIGS